MSFLVSVTRLRVRSLRFLPAFFFATIQTNRQVQAAPGFLKGALLPDRRRTFWTLTLWDGEQSMRDFMTNGPHRAVMPKLLDWCDEASVARWLQDAAVLPSWEDAGRRMRQEGRASKVRYPNASHAGLGFEAPRTSGSVPLNPKSP